MNVLLGVTGSVAAIRTPELYAALRHAGHHVRIVATKAAEYFFDVATIEPRHASTPERNRDIVILDEDEWPGQRYRRDDAVMHIELRRWAEIFVIAPLDANTLAKLAAGICDNCLTCVWRAWDPLRPVILAPAMNTLMWEHPLTRNHLRQLAEMLAPEVPPNHLSITDLLAWINRACPHLRLVAPQSKRLACGDVGTGAMADADEIVAMLAQWQKP